MGKRRDILLKEFFEIVQQAADIPVEHTPPLELCQDIQIGDGKKDGIYIESYLRVGVEQPGAQIFQRQDNLRSLAELPRMGGGSISAHVALLPDGRYYDLSPNTTEEQLEHIIRTISSKLL
jgi:hypothetical protein